jgi:hypothetical protein
MMHKIVLVTNAVSCVRPQTAQSSHLSPPNAGALHELVLDDEIRTAQRFLPNAVNVESEDKIAQ